MKFEYPLESYEKNETNSVAKQVRSHLKYFLDGEPS